MLSDERLWKASFRAKQLGGVYCRRVHEERASSHFTRCSRFAHWLWERCPLCGFVNGALYQAVYTPPKFKATDKTRSFADQFPTTPAARSRLPLTSFAAQYPTTMAGALTAPRSAPAATAKAAPAAMSSYVAAAPAKKKPSFADLYPTTPAGQANNPSPKSFAQSYPTTLTGKMAPKE